MFGGIKRFLERSEMARHVLTLMSGTALAQAIALLLSFVIARLYSPSDFATLEQFAMLLAVLGVMVTGKYEFAVMLPKGENEARHLTVLAIRVAAIFSFLIAVLSLFFSDTVSQWFGNPELEIALLFLGPVVFLSAFTNTFTFWFNRQKKYRDNATGKVLFSAVSDPVKLLTGMFGASGVFLVVSVSLGHFVHSLYLFLRNSSLFRFFKTDRELLRKLRTEHSNYPRYIVPGSLMNTLAQWLHIAVFSAFFGLWAIGFLALSRRVIMSPLNILAQSFSQVYYQRISEIESAKKLKSHYLHYLIRFSLFALGIIILVWVLPSNTIGWLFGEEWMELMSFLRILVFWFATNFIVSSLSFINHRLKRERLVFVLNLVHLVLIIVGLGIAYLLDMDEIAALIVLVTSKVLFYLINVIATVGALNRNIRLNTKLKS